MGKDDERLARQQSARDLQNLKGEASKLGSTLQSYESVVSAKNDFGDGERVLISFTIGMRGYFSRSAARIAAKTWRKVCAKHPKAFFILTVLGYDEDPREIWEFEEARHYVCQWAHLAGLGDFEVARKLLVRAPVEAVHVNGSLGFLAACGVFGEEKRQETLAASGMMPTPKQ